jgi:hypothetical protein
MIGILLRRLTGWYIRGTTPGSREMIEAPRYCVYLCFLFQNENKALTFDDLMQIEYQEKNEKDILDVISSCQPVSDGRN